MIRLPRLPGFRPASGFLAAASALSLAWASAGCYGFAGGGLPPGIRTVAVLPFDNLTPEPSLTQEVSDAVRDVVAGRLGLREAAEDGADAVVRGTITRYEPDLPVAFTGEDAGVNVSRRKVEITLTVEILDQRENRTLWQRSGLRVEGDYEPGEGEAEGREKALERLKVNIVEGAQSQW